MWAASAAESLDSSYTTEKKHALQSTILKITEKVKEPKTNISSIFTTNVFTPAPALHPPPPTDGVETQTDFLDVEDARIRDLEQVNRQLHFEKAALVSTLEIAHARRGLRVGAACQTTENVVNEDEYRVLKRQCDVYSAETKRLADCNRVLEARLLTALSQPHNSPAPSVSPAPPCLHNGAQEPSEKIYKNMCVQTLSVRAHAVDQVLADYAGGKLLEAPALKSRILALITDDCVSSEWAADLISAFFGIYTALLTLLKTNNHPDETIKIDHMLDVLQTQSIPVKTRTAQDISNEESVNALVFENKRMGYEIVSLTSQINDFKLECEILQKTVLEYQSVFPKNQELMDTIHMYTNLLKDEKHQREKLEQVLKSISQPAVVVASSWDTLVKEIQETIGNSIVDVDKLYTIVCDKKICEEEGRRLSSELASFFWFILGQNERVKELLDDIRGLEATIQANIADKNTEVSKLTAQISNLQKDLLLHERGKNIVEQELSKCQETCSLQTKMFTSLSRCLDDERKKEGFQNCFHDVYETDFSRLSMSLKEILDFQREKAYLSDTKSHQVEEKYAAATRALCSREAEISDLSNRISEMDALLRNQNMQIEDIQNQYIEKRQCLEKLEKKFVKIIKGCFLLVGIQNPQILNSATSKILGNIKNKAVL